jgi:hypothetical protein
VTAAARASRPEIIDLSDEAMLDDDSPTVRIDREELDVLLQVSTPASAWTPGPVVARCTCCTMSYTQAAWGGLHYVGIQDGGALGCVELRNCACGSTIAVEAVAPLSDWRSLPKTIPAPAMGEDES